MPSTPCFAIRRTVAPISTALSAAAVSVVMKGLPVPEANSTTRPFSRWRNGAAPDVGLRDLRHVDGALGARRDAVGPFEGVLKREGVHDGGEHPHVVGGRPVHAGGFRLAASPDVAAADYDAQLDSQVVGLHYLGGHEVDGGWIDAVPADALEGLPAQLQEDSAVLDVGHRCYSPRENRVNLPTLTFSPSVPTA